MCMQMGGIMWFCIPFTLATTMGLSALALDLPITLAESGSGAVRPATRIAHFCLQPVTAQHDPASLCSMPYFRMACWQQVRSGKWVRALRQPCMHAPQAWCRRRLLSSSWAAPAPS